MAIQLDFNLLFDLWIANALCSVLIWNISFYKIRMLTFLDQKYKLQEHYKLLSHSSGILATDLFLKSKYFKWRNFCSI